VLIGEPGVGKTAIADGLAQKIVVVDVPEILRGKRVLALDLGGMVAGAKYRGEFEERLKGVLDEIQRSKDVVLFIDELHTGVGAGAAEGAIDASNMMKPMLARGELQCVGATTLDEYRRHIEKDAALERRFQPILVGEPNVDETIAILEGLRDKYEAHHKVKITDDAIRSAATLSDRYISDRFLPDKAIDLVDEAASKLRVEAPMLPPDLREMELRLQELSREGAAAVQAQDYERAAQLKEQTDKIQSTFVTAKDAWLADKGIADATVDADDIAELVSEWTGIPVQRMLQAEADKLLAMEEKLHSRVIGQDRAVEAVSEAVRRARAGLKDPKRPIGSFIFLGPTGVGKTELARALAEYLFDDEAALIRLDMSEYMEKHTVSRLVGAPPGYVGYDEGGQLTEAVRRRPYSVILFDEIEKAHPDVFNALLQILDDGRLTDGKGRTVDFKNTVVIMTSNVGTSVIHRHQLGFVPDGVQPASHEDFEKTLTDELRKTFRPEFLNRVDEIIVFDLLDREQLAMIVDLLLAHLRRQVEGQGMQLEVSKPAEEYIAEQGYDAEFGARPLKRAIQRLVENPLSSALLRGEFREGDTIKVDIADGALVFAK
jgi:ATP-dependent Clp protease ATP-binding subunit ClpC